MTSDRNTAVRKFRVQGQTLVFSSGRRITAQRGVVGLSPSLEAFHGYDGILVLTEPFLDDNDALTDEERTELADYMLDRWQAFKNLSRPDPA